MRHNLSQAIPDFTKKEAVEALLAAARFGNTRSRRMTLQMAADLGGNQLPEYLKASIAYSRSVLLRLEGDFHYSDRVIQEFLNGSRSEPMNKRLHSMHGFLYISHMENMLQLREERRLLAEMDAWGILGEPSLMELRVVQSKVVLFAKHYRFRGQFTEAQYFLEKSLGIIPPEDISRYQVVANLADIYCELCLPNEASIIVTPEIEALRNCGKRGKAIKRLILASIEADIGRGWFEEAERSIEEMIVCFSRMVDCDISEQLFHVRTLIASARIAHCKSQFFEALGRWETSLKCVRKYASFKNTGFTCAVIHLSLSHAHLEIGNNNEGRTAFEFAEKIFQMETRDFRIPILATSWLEFVLSRIYTLTKWAQSEMLHQKFGFSRKM